MGKKKPTTSLGRSLVKDRFGGKSRTKKSDDSSFLHTSELNDGYDWGRLNLQSVTEQSQLDDFLATAELAGTEFTAERLNVAFVNPDENSGLLSAEEMTRVKKSHEEHRALLRIPRRPHWDESTTGDELDLLERESFLDWRRQLAELQDEKCLIMTPFEKNLDFWRQLWRVIERSDIIIQIVDGRNPLLYRCEDLETYVKEMGDSKMNMILVNKADLLTQKQRMYWADYFNKVGVRVAFWSAVAENERQKQLKLEEEAELNQDAIDDDDEDDDDEDDDDDEEEMDAQDESEKTDNPKDNSPSNMDTARLSPQENNTDSTQSSGDSNRTMATESHDSQDLIPTAESAGDSVNQESGDGESQNLDSVSAGSGEIRNSERLLNGDELVELMKNLHSGNKVTEGITTVGLVGYPNVGKSSTINAILQTKKVPVSATPGRTKHFQTLFVDKSLLLCDCPGLVMPTFVSSKAEMVISGILPIDQMRDHVPPISLLAALMPRPLLEATYGINLPPPAEGQDPNRPPTAYEVTNAYGYMRGFMTSRGAPDGPRSARILLKDMVNGKLLFCHPPPGVSAEDFRPTPEAPQRDKVKATYREEGNVTNPSSNTQVPKYSNAVDREFFKQRKQHAHTRGVLSQRDGATEGGSAALVGKPWKKHGNRNKKEKTRRVFSAMDM